MFAKSIDYLQSAEQPDLLLGFGQYGKETLIFNTRALVLALKKMLREFDRGELKDGELRAMSDHVLADYAKGRLEQAAKARQVVLAYRQPPTSQKKDHRDKSNATASGELKDGELRAMSDHVLTDRADRQQKRAAKPRIPDKEDIRDKKNVVAI